MSFIFTAYVLQANDDTLDLVNREKPAEVTSDVSKTPPVTETVSHTSNIENMSPRTVTSRTVEKQTDSTTSTSIEVSTTSTSIEIPSESVSETLSDVASTSADITSGNIDTSTAVESVGSTEGNNNEPPTPDFSDFLMSPGGRSDVTVAYEDHDTSAPRTPTPTFQSPQSRSPRKSKAALLSRENPTERCNTPVTQRLDDPVHPPTPCRVFEPEEAEEQNIDSLLEDTNIFAQRPDPVHLPSPQHSRTDSPVSQISEDCVTRRRNLSLSTPPPPSPFSALSVSTPSPEIFPSTVVELDPESQKLITSARNRISEEVER